MKKISRRTFISNLSVISIPIILGSKSIGSHSSVANNSNTSPYMKDKDALIVVDVQNDFCPRGSLPVKNGNEIIPVINAIQKYISNSIEDDNIIIDFSKLGKNKFFYDVIYNPKQTNFLKKAKDMGNITENGKMMFIYQAQKSFEKWHKILPKINSEILDLLDD